MNLRITAPFIALGVGVGVAAGAVTNEYRTAGVLELVGFPAADYTISFDVFPQAADEAPGDDLGRYAATIEGFTDIGVTLTGTGFVQPNVPEQRYDLIFDDAIVSIPGVGDLPFSDDFFVELPIPNDDQPTEIIAAKFAPPLETDVEIAPGVAGVIKTSDFVFEPFCPGDINDTLNTDSQDLNLLLSDFGCVGEDCIGDVDGDGDTDSADLNELLAGFGGNCPAP